MTVHAMIRPLDFTGYTIPEHTQAALRRYVEQGIEPGGFLTAVLCNDLMGAVSRADDYNVRCIADIARFVYNEIPAACWGNQDKIYCWMRMIHDTIWGRDQ